MTECSEVVCVAVVAEGVGLAAVGAQKSALIQPG